MIWGITVSPVRCDGLVMRQTNQSAVY